MSVYPLMGIPSDEQVIAPRFLAGGNHLANQTEHFSVHILGFINNHRSIWKDIPLLFEKMPCIPGCINQFFKSPIVQLRPVFLENSPYLGAVTPDESAPPAGPTGPQIGCQVGNALLLDDEEPVGTSPVPLRDS